jgi:hypothetical protein
MREEGGNAMKACLLLFLSLAIISCAPPYSAELNSSAGIAGQMTLIGTMGPVSSPDGNSTTAIRFLPIKPTATTTTLGQLSVQSGFLVSESSGQERLDFAFQGSGGNVQTTNSVGSFSLAGADPNYPLYQYEVTTTTTTGNILVFNMGPILASRTVQLFSADLTNGSLASPTGFSNPESLYSLFMSQSAVGAQVSSNPLPTPDYVNFLVPVGSGYAEGLAYTLSGVTSLFTIASTTLAVNSALALPPNASRFLYYHDQTAGRSYASYYDTSGQWVCYQWTPPPTSFTTLPGITHPIAALLTDGDLISTDGGTLTIYDLNGTELNSVPLGGMQFCYEAYVGNTPYVFFSLSMGFPHQSWAFRVYAIPTSALRGLKG